MRNSPRRTAGSGVNDGISRALAKLNDTSVTRSLITGNVRIGVSVIGSPGSKVDIRVMQASRGRPLISIEQDPHLPALQFQRTARSPAWVAWRRCRMSSTTSPSFASTW